MTRYLPLLLAATAAVLSGCTLAPTYVRPDSPVPAAWPNILPPPESSGASTNPAAADLAWRDFFTHAQLQQVIGLALTNNRDLRVAALAVERAQALYRIQRADLLPTVNTVGSAVKQKTYVSVQDERTPVTVQEFDVNLGVSAWELDLFGRLRSLKASALERYLATEQARRSAQIALVAEVAHAYLALAASREQLKLAQETLASQEASLALIHRRFEVGHASELDLRQAQTRAETARVDIARYAGLTDQARNALELLAGAPVPAELLSDILLPASALRELRAGLPSETLLRRPDILRAENELKAVTANIGAARAAFFPRISLTAAYGTVSDELSGLFTSGSEAWSFAPRIVLPIFDTGRSLAGLKTVQVERDIALAQYEKAIQTAFREVADALVQGKSLADQVTAQQALVDAVAQTHRLAEARYLKGIDSYLTVLDAQRSLYAAQQGLIGLRFARMSNALTLYKVLGGG